MGIVFFKPLSEPINGCWSDINGLLLTFLKNEVENKISEGITPNNGQHHSMNFFQAYRCSHIQMCLYWIVMGNISNCGLQFKKSAAFRGKNDKTHQLIDCEVKEERIKPCLRFKSLENERKIYSILFHLAIATSRNPYL